MNVLFVMCKTWKTNKPLPYLVLLSTFNIFVLFAERKVCKVIYGNKGVYRCISVLMYCMCLMSTVCIYAYVWVCVFHMLIHSIIPKSKMYFAPKKKICKSLQNHVCFIIFFCSVMYCPTASADKYVFHFPEKSWQRSNVSVQSMTQRVKPARRRAAPTQPFWPSFVCSGKQRLHHRPDWQGTG